MNGEARFKWNEQRMNFMLIVLILLLLGGCSPQNTTPVNNEAIIEEGEADAMINKVNEEVADPLASPTPEGYARVKLVDDEGLMYTLEQSISRPLQLPINFPYPLPTEDIEVLDSDRGIYPDGQITYHVRFDSTMPLEELVAFYTAYFNEQNIGISEKINDESNVLQLIADTNESVTVSIEDSYDSSNWVTINTARQ